MGNHEGLSSASKRKVHDVYVKDKADTRSCVLLVFFVILSSHIILFPKVRTMSQWFFFVLFPTCLSSRLAWFIHENLENFPEKYLTDEFAPLGYSCQGTSISPQRFGKPMHRLDGWTKIFQRDYDFPMFSFSSKWWWHEVSCLQVAILPHLLWHRALQLGRTICQGNLEACGPTPKIAAQCRWYVLLLPIRVGALVIKGTSLVIKGHCCCFINSFGISLPLQGFG